MNERFPAGLERRLQRNRLTRRDVLWLFGAAAAAGSLSGCATSPVTGQRILVGMSEEQERQVDREVAPHQFSQDMGAVQDDGVNRYVAGLGGQMQPLTQRPHMPYSYRVVNANYINAYTFPAGAMAVTRGIMTELESEAELAALLGHEMGHVNARHAAQRQGQAMLAQVAVIGLAVGAAAPDSRWGAAGRRSAGRSAPARCWRATRATTSARPTRWVRSTWCAPATPPTAWCGCTGCWSTRTSATPACSRRCSRRTR